MKRVSAPFDRKPACDCELIKRELMFEKAPGQSDEQAQQQMVQKNAENAGKRLRSWRPANPARVW